MERTNKKRLDMLWDHLQEACVEGCNGKWLDYAKAILTKNNVEVADFLQAVYNLLDNGRGKYRNVLIVGPENCGKTFMLKPLNLVFDCFNIPASSTFAWVGAEQVEVIVLNDFRWNSKLIEWSDLLNLLDSNTSASH